MKLREYLKKTRTSQATFGAQIGVSQQRVATFCAGRVPKQDVMRKIVEATAGKVTPNDFYDLPPEAGAEPLAQDAAA